MVTSVQNVIGQAYLPQAAGAGSSQNQPKSGATDSAAGSAEKVSISQEASLQPGVDRSIQAGKLVNQTDQTYAKQQHLLNHMNDQLQAIVKQFPPYGAEDPQRLAYLNSFSGLRQVIQALQIPKDPNAEAGLPKGVNLQSQGAGLNLPDLSGSSVSDQQVADAARQVQSALAQVTKQREALAQSIQTALGGSEYSGQVARFA